MQDLLSGDRVIYTAMADLAMRWSEGLFGRNGYSQIGAVVGATYPQTLRLLREKYDRLFFLVPGYGAQGGTARERAGRLRPLRPRRDHHRLAQHHLRMAEQRLRRAGLLRARRRGCRKNEARSCGYVTVL